MPCKQQSGKFLVHGVEPRQGSIEDVAQTFQHLLIRHVPPLLVLIDAGLGHRHVQARHDAQLPLRNAGGLPRLADAQCHDAQRFLRWRVL